MGLRSYGAACKQRSVNIAFLIRGKKTYAHYRVVSFSLCSILVF